MRLAPAPEADTLATRIATARHQIWRHPMVAGVASGLLLWTSFPPLEWHALAWVALAPLFWVVTLREARFKAYLAAWLGGLVFWLLALEWLRMLEVGGWTGWVVMSLVFSCWWPLFVAIARLAIFRLRLPLMMAAPIIWVGLEYGRAYFLSGFPWYYLAHSQFRNLYLIQIADIASSLGISLLIALVNAMVVDLVMLPLFGRTPRGIRLHPRQYVRLCVVTCLIGTTVCYGAIRVSSATVSRRAEAGTLAVEHPSEAQKYRRRGSDRHRVRGPGRECAGARGRTRPDRLAGDGLSLQLHRGGSRLPPEAFEQQVRSISPKWSGKEWRERMKWILNQLHSWTDRVQVPMLVGILYDDHQSERAKPV